MLYTHAYGKGSLLRTYSLGLDYSASLEALFFIVCTVFLDAARICHPGCLQGNGGP